jgi:hypothetical protein
MAIGILALVYRHRAELYTLPGIVNKVDGHGNNRTGSKVDQLFKVCAAAMGHGADTGAAKAAARAPKGGSGGGGGKGSKAGNTKTKVQAKDKPEGPKGRKRKNMSEDEEDVKPEIESEIKEPLAGLSAAEIRDIERIKL